MENVAVVLFEVESEGYQAFSELKSLAVSPQYVVSQSALVKNVAGRIVPLEWNDTGVNTTDDITRGGLIGLVVGVIGGPLGMLLGASYGTLLGGLVDTADSIDESSIINVVAGKLLENEVAIIALVKEEDEQPFDTLFARYGCQIIRFDAADMAQQVEEARDAEAELQRQARAQLRAQKKADREQKIAERRAAIQASFEEFEASL